MISNGFSITTGSRFGDKLLTEMRRKTNIQRVFLTSFCGECGESRWIIYFHRFLDILRKMARPYAGSKLLPHACLQHLIPLRKLSLTAMIFPLNLSKRWKTNPLNFCAGTAVNAVKLAVNFCKKCGQMPSTIFSPHSPLFFYKKIHRIQRISCNNSTKNLGPGSQHSEQWILINVALFCGIMRQSFL